MQWWSRFKMQTRQVVQWRDRGGTTVSHSVQTFQRVGLAFGGCIISSPTILVLKIMTATIFPTILNIMKVPTTKFNLWNIEYDFITAGITIHNSNQYIIGIAMITNNVEIESLIVRGYGRVLSFIFRFINSFTAIFLLSTPNIFNPITVYWLLIYDETKLYSINLKIEYMCIQ